MADDKDVAVQVQEHLERWNPGSRTDEGVHRLLGDRVPEGDTRATAAYNPGNAGVSPLSDKVDAQRMDLYRDDMSQGSEGPQVVDPRVPYSERTVQELKDEIDRRNEGRDKDDRISKTGKQSDLAARLEEDDEGDEDDDEG